ncbi:hypothetical protein EXIGLDRAFT_839279 [Exidia glandulosa HHB12029]|uniref:Protein kinase domain-containing protein n=1 Tax=Exidia glandulosa HHB12029 TaxID=1314781 RepID=A0A165F3T8_EXIGL|nr:hypothetical protein EXIGLDRAFT_839279 [Exidia glandulosa HHB12029]
MDFVLGFNTYVGDPNAHTPEFRLSRPGQRPRRRVPRRQWVGFTSDPQSTGPVPTMLCVGIEIDRRGVDSDTPSSSLLYRGIIATGPDDVLGLQVWIKGGCTPGRIARLKHESSVYDSLHALQGVSVARSLGLFYRKPDATYPEPTVPGCNIPDTILILVHAGRTLDAMEHPTRSAFRHLRWSFREGISDAILALHNNGYQHNRISPAAVARRGKRAILIELGHVTEHQCNRDNTLIVPGTYTPSEVDFGCNEVFDTLTMFGAVWAPCVVEICGRYWSAQTLLCDPVLVADEAVGMSDREAITAVFDEIEDYLSCFYPWDKISRNEVKRRRADVIERFLCAPRIAEPEAQTITATDLDVDGDMGPKADIVWRPSWWTTSLSVALVGCTLGVVFIRRSQM